MNNQVLIDYVLKQKEKGVSDKDLRKVLLKNKWPKEDVETALTIASGKSVVLHQISPKPDIFITIVSIADYLLGAFLILAGLVMILFKRGLIAYLRFFDIGLADAVSGSLLIVAAIVLMMMGIIPVLIGHSFYLLRKWAWIATMVLCIIGVLLVFWNVYLAGLCLILVVFMLKKQTRNAFFGYV